jgi:putative flippase GtrA
MRDKKEFVSYIVFGILTTIINIVSYAFFTKIMGTDYRSATTIAWFVAVVFAFITNKIYVFNSKSTLISSLAKEFISFMLFRLLSYVADLGMMIVLVEWMNMKGVLAKIIANAVVVVLNYFASRYLIFNTSKSTAAHPEE